MLFMGIVWGFVKAIALVFAVVIAGLVVLDGSLLANVLKRTGD